MNSAAKIASTAAVLSAVAACALTRGNSNATSSPSGQIHVFESDANGFNTKTVFYDTGTEVVAFDAQFTPSLAEQALAYLRTKTANPVTYLVITHPNPDKFNGLGVFKDQGAQIVASQATLAAMPNVHAYKKYFFVNIAKMFTDETYPALGTADVTFADRLDLHLGNGESIHLAELSGAGVSSNQTVAHIPSVNALIVGDLIHHKAHAWLEGGIVDGKPQPTLASWVKDIEELSTRFGKLNPTVFGGRGDAVPLREAGPTQTAYLNKADRIVTDYVTSLGDRRTELSGSEAQGHFANIQKQLEAAFPAYALPYMIQYGVYGLALSK